MPVRLERMELDIQELKTGQQELRADTARNRGDISNLKGDDHESFVAESARRKLWRETSIRATIFSTKKARGKLTELAINAGTQGRTGAADADSLDEADLALTVDVSQDYILDEVSVTVQQRDVYQARRRAAKPQAARQLP